MWLVVAAALFAVTIPSCGEEEKFPELSDGGMPDGGAPDAGDAGSPGDGGNDGGTDVISATGYTFNCDPRNSQGAACNVTLWWEHIDTPHTDSVIYLTKEQACDHVPIDDNGEMVQGTTSNGRDSLRVYKDGVPLTVGGSLIPPPTTDRFIGYRDRAAWTKAMLGCDN